MNEGGTRQLTTTVELDDATFLDLPPEAFSWGFNPGIATSVSVFLGDLQSPDLSLTVLNIDDDNYLGYGSDGIEDGWQVTYYGAPPNAEAAPGFDKDFDGDDNTKEFLFGTSPLDGNDFFRLIVAGYSAPETVDLVGNLFIPGRTYTLMSAPDLDSFVPVGSPFSVGSVETDMPLQDTRAREDAKFYVMQVEWP